MKKLIGVGVATAAALTAVVFGRPMMQSADASESKPADKSGVTSQSAGAGSMDCRSWVEGDGHKGVAQCTNNTSQAQAFRAVVVCGWEPDNTGEWHTVNPGQTASSWATCSPLSTGVGSVSWEFG